MAGDAYVGLSDMCGLPARGSWKSPFGDGSRIGGSDVWLMGAWYDGFDVGGSRLRLGPMPDGIVGVVVGVGRGVSGCSSPVSSDSGCEVMPGALARYM